jgi:hypothetical protein
MLKLFKDEVQTVLFKYSVCAECQFLSVTPVGARSQ